MSGQRRAAEACSRRLRVLADPTRLAVLRALRGQALHVQDLGAAMGIGQSLLSHHLRVLRDAGLVCAMRDGKAVLYRLADDVRPPVEAGDSIDLGCCRLDFGAGAGRVRSDAVGD